MQTVFGWFEEQQVTKVRRLLRFHANGNLAVVGYQHWLEWFTPLNGGNRAVRGCGPWLEAFGGAA